MEPAFSSEAEFAEQHAPIHRRGRNVLGRPREIVAEERTEIEGVLPLVTMAQAKSGGRMNRGVPSALLVGAARSQVHWGTAAAPTPHPWSACHLHPNSL